MVKPEMKRIKQLSVIERRVCRFLATLLASFLLGIATWGFVVTAVAMACYVSPHLDTTATYYIGNLVRYANNIILWLSTSFCGMLFAKALCRMWLPPKDARDV